MQLHITQINQDKGYRFNSYSCPSPSDKPFRALQKEFGRCRSKVYIGDGIPVGWAFEKKEPYQDFGSFIQVTWVEAINDNPES